MLYVVGLLVIIGIIVIYISIEKEKPEIKNKFDYKKTDFFDEVRNIDIKDEKLLELKTEIKKYIIGTDNLINSIIIAILSNGHIIVEGVPGLAKTKTILVFSKLLGLSFKRIQFTPDMLPSDIIGGEIYNKNTGKFEIFQGPVFTNLLLGDEINRATPKVQSALLEAMQEKNITIGNKTFELDRPFFVMATQNPLEQEGTFPLPEAQLDRFLFKVVVSYPNKEEEKQILDTFEQEIENIENIISKDNIIEMQEKVNNIELSSTAKNYIVDIVSSTRDNDDEIMLGASTRASIALKKTSCAVAYLQGKNIVEIEDVKKVVLPILRHRVKIDYNTSLSVDEVIIKKIIKVRDFNI